MTSNVDVVTENILLNLLYKIKSNKIIIMVFNSEKIILLIILLLLINANIKFCI